MPGKPRFIALLSALTLCGCGGSGEPDEGGGSTSGGAGGSGAAGGSGGATGCEDRTEFAGDCFALEPPAPGEGFQLRYGPSSYDDPVEMEKFLLQPGEEVVDCLHMTTPNDIDILYDRYEMTARSGTHHVIIWAGGTSPLPDGTLVDCPATGGSGSRWLFGQQSALGDVEGGRVEYPPPSGVAPENEGLGWKMEAKTHISYQVHFVNTGTEPILREAWANIYYAPDGAVTQVIDTIAFIGGLGLNIPPHTRFTTDTQTCDLPPGSADEVRILNLTGHMHAHGKRFTAWKVDEAGNRELIYETHDWAEADNLAYNSSTENPTPDASTKKGGGASGVLTIGTDERIEYECEYDNTSDGYLRWANEAYTAEMCNFIGFYTPSFGRPWGCQNL